MLIDKMIGSGADPHAVDSNGENAAHYGARGCDPQQEFANTMQRLICCGVDLELENIFGHRPLHIAALNNRAHAVRALLAQAVDMRAINHEGHTARQIAHSLKENEICAIFESHSAMAAIEQLLQTTRQRVASRIAVSG